MIHSLRLRGFKALADIELKFAPITVLIGPNGTGKSSVLQFFSVLNQSWGNNTLQASGNYVNLGDFNDIAHNHDAERGIEFAIELTSGRSPLKAVQDVHAIEYRASVRSDGVSAHSLQFLPSPSDAPKIEWSSAKASNELFEWPIHPGFIALMRLTSTLGNPVEIGGYRGQPAESEQREVQRFLSVPSRVSNYVVIPALRGFEATAYPLENKASQNFFQTGTPAEQASRVLSTIAYRRELEEEISRFSREVLQIDFRTRLIAGKNVAAEAIPVSSSGRRILNNIVNEGFGVNQLMILLAQLVLVPSGSVVAIEEPEIHLHPLAQSDLSDVLLQVARESGKQLIITSHSEHILMGILRNVAQGRLPPSDLCVYYFTREDGQTKVENLAVNDQGRLKGGLKGFFEASIQEMDDFLGRSMSKVRRREP